MAKSNYKTFYELVIVTTTLVTLFCKFFKVVVEKGKLAEFFITTPILIAVYYGMYQLHLHDGQILLYLLPFTIYAVYWSITLCDVPIYKGKTDSTIHWADEDWWWALDGWQFEEEVAKVFRKYGYKATVTKKTGDGGADIIMYKDKKKIIVQCKHYANAVGPEPVRALWGIKGDLKADEVMLVASSGVTKAAEKFIKPKHVFYVYTLQDIISMAIRK